MAKLVSLYIILLWFQEPIDDGKPGLTVLLKFLKPHSLKPVPWPFLDF